MTPTPTPTPDYGEPWHPQLLPSPISKDKGVYWLNPRQFNRAVDCVNACAGMADPAKEIEAMREAIKLAEVALDMADNEIYPPNENCSCHINPPCNDCVDNSQARETKKFIKLTLTKLQPYTTP